MKFFTTSQIRELDKFTIDHEPIASIDLMERAANALCWEFIGNFPYQQPVCIFAGPGNNGGDALALARILLKSGFEVSVQLLYTDKLSTDCETNRNRLVEAFPDSLTDLINQFVAPKLSDETIIIDGLFGSGLSRPLSGIFAQSVEWINNTENMVVSIDIPSGLQGEENPDLSVPIIKADFTFSLQFPKLAFFFTETEKFIGKWEVVDIGILPEAIQGNSSNLYYLEQKDIVPLQKKRSRFSHKGSFGHALIVTGSKGMAGASVLSSKAAMRAGAGLVTVHGPECNRIIVQTSIQEVIFQSDIHLDVISEVQNMDKFNTIAVGPGIGTSSETIEMLRDLLSNLKEPCILDADALNIISQNMELLELVPGNSILTPHPKEFERIFGESATSYDRMIKAQEAALRYKIFIILKGAYTFIVTPDGQFYFNSTGNSGMATAGSGDVLTGILTGLLAQGYKPEEAAKLGVFIHGRSGDLVLENESKESLIASDIIDNLGKAFKSVQD
jgi:ADP-dependent NAD(P)H-hydrate dehydratase / NAD(P)H-hydrate epimerase